MIDNVPVAAARALGATRTVVVRLHAKWENVRMMRTATRTADLVRDPSIVLIQPDMERMAQWTMADVPRLIAEGRRAATTALDAAARDERLAPGDRPHGSVGETSRMSPLENAHVGPQQA
jgi:NTE family protein